MTMRTDLHALEQRWGLAVESAGFGVWDLDVQRQTVHYPPQWKAMLGYGSDDAADATSTWRSRVHPDDLQPMLDALSGHLEGRDATYEAEFRLRAADGSWRWVLSRGRVVERDAQGRPLRAIGTLTDLTDRKQAERLRIERDLADAASRAKTEFLTRMSHELRTPLNAVLGFAQLLAKEIGRGDAATQRRYVEHIEQAGWQLLQLIDDVLDLSGHESGRLQMVIEPVPLAPLVQRAVADMGPRAAQQEVRLGVAALPPQAAVRADAARLDQVLANLLSNAIKYNRRGGAVTVEVSGQADAWTLSVSDTGNGIPAAQIPHLFEPFNRIGRGVAGVGGISVGLALSRALVDTMGGRLAVDSTEGVGSRFSVTLPAAAPAS